jgi:cytochrome c oxidase subunit 3
MALFIISEVFFFVSFFWAFFHCSLAPAIGIGCVWPPLGIVTLDPWGLPLWNTVILLSSGVTITCAHRGILAGERGATNNGLLATIGYGIVFTFVQAYEYDVAPFSINDN